MQESSSGVLEIILRSWFILMLLIQIRKGSIECTKLEITKTEEKLFKGKNIYFLYGLFALLNIFLLVNLFGFDTREVIVDNTIELFLLYFVVWSYGGMYKIGRFTIGGRDKGLLKEIYRLHGRKKLSDERLEATLRCINKEAMRGNKGSREILQQLAEEEGDLGERVRRILAEITDKEQPLEDGLNVS